MYSSKVFVKLCLIIAIMILSVGVFMKFQNIESNGFYISKSGTRVDSTLDANSTLIIGFIVACCCAFGYYVYRQRKKYTEKMREIEKNEERLGKKYNIFKIRKMRK